MTVSLKTVLLGLVAASVLASCAPVSVYYREGAEVSRIDASLTDCRVDALAKVPVKELRRFVPPTYGYRNICNGSGHCYSQRYLLRPGYFETYDANEALRHDVTKQCMTGKGFERVQIPACSPAVTEETTIRATRVQPKLTENSCSIRIRNGKYQIVNP